MNYRHAYHAGNFADVFKHAVQALILRHLARKDSPFAVIDTHAGLGRYDLDSIEAGKTLEWQAGIGRVMDHPDPVPPELEPYLAVVRAMNGDGPLRRYPGSPWLARQLLRPQDRLLLAELHPQDAETLRALFARDPQTRVEAGQDGYQALKGWVPPKERRGLVLIDPPFEKTDEFERTLRAMHQARKRWPTGVYAIWYPIKDRPPVDAFLAALAAQGPEPCLAAELLVLPTDNPFRLNGCGMAIVNPPWQLDEACARLVPELVKRLDRPKGGGGVRWLVAAK